MAMSPSNMSGIATIDLGLNPGNTLTQQVQDEVNDRKKKAQQQASQRQMFPATGMLLGSGPMGSGGAY